MKSVKEEMAGWRALILVELKGTDELAGRDESGARNLQPAQWAAAEIDRAERANEMFARLGLDHRLTVPTMANPNHAFRPEVLKLTVPVPFGEQEKYAALLRKEPLVRSVTVPRNPVKAPSREQIGIHTPSERRGGH